MTQKAATTPTSPKKSGMDAAIMNAMDQYSGTMAAQIIFPFLVVRGGKLKRSIRTFFLDIH